jgi:hypothetical protein
MSEKKKYTNATFTKRVDHEAGRHHTERAASEPRVCGKCGSVYADRRWTAAETERKNSQHEHWRPARITVCPACKQKQSGVPGGFVYLDGAYFAEHRAEVERLLRNEAGRAAEDNPLAQIMDWESGADGKLTVTTTTEHLAQRLGRALEKAFSGEVRYDFSHENKLARVTWERN